MATTARPEFDGGHADLEECPGIGCTVAPHGYRGLLVARHRIQKRLHQWVRRVHIRGRAGDDDLDRLRSGITCLAQYLVGVLPGQVANVHIHTAGIGHLIHRITTDDAGNVDGVVFTMPGMERTAKKVEP